MAPILASGSATRQKMLADAGIAYEAHPADLDERSAAQPLLDAGAPADDIALALALGKADTVSAAHPGRLVIGADQTLDLDGDLLTKSETMEAARYQLLNLSGKTHRLHSAAVLVRDGTVVWQRVETVHLTMRRFGPETVGRYLALVGDKVLGSVGAYQIEGPGLPVFEKIDGDYFAVLGLPLLSLIAALRSEGALDL